MKNIMSLLVILFFLTGSVVSVQGGSDIKKLVFEEQRIEGKIRRPQLVLIKADQRPEFTPMVLQSLGKNGSITASFDKSIIEESPYKGPFQFDGTRIINYVP